MMEKSILLASTGPCHIVPIRSENSPFRGQSARARRAGMRVSRFEIGGVSVPVSIWDGELSEVEGGCCGIGQRVEWIVSVLVGYVHSL